VDGGIHLFREEYDEERTRYLESSGIRVLRFTNQEIETIIDSAIDVINKFLESDP
jgi:very-short-patch-repair endonuclease